METVLSARLRQAPWPVADASHVASVRRAAADLAMQAGMDETRSGEVALLVTEAATNILKHAGSGEILLRPLQHGSQAGIEILALDRGPGMRNIAESMADGTTTAGSYGIGLGALRRLAQEFDAFSAPGLGTVLRMTAWAGEMPPAASFDYGVVCLPIQGEVVCGDAWGLAFDETRAVAVLADGLGHGPDAARASEAATALVGEGIRLSPTDLLHDMHAALRAMRGAAISVAEMDAYGDKLQYAGVGNIAGTLFGGQSRRQLISHNGIVGSNMRKVQEIGMDWVAGSMLVMHSDGLGTRWDLSHYPGLTACHASIIAAVMYRDFSRRSDDVTVLVVQDHRRSSA